MMRSTIIFMDKTKDESIVIDHFNSKERERTIFNRWYKIAYCIYLIFNHMYLPHCISFIMRCLITLNLDTAKHAMSSKTPASILVIIKYSINIPSLKKLINKYKIRVSQYINNTRKYT